MNLLILKGFNNYFNRKLKKYSTLEDYMNQSSAYYNFGDINFNPNDGVSTSQIVGSENQKEIGGSEPEPLKWEVEGSPDYIIAYEQETIDNNVITHIRSRWFIMESVRTRNGQYKLALKRDVLADYLQTILRSECFVEKGWVTTDNPLIFNEENVSLNQIKKGETMLTDETGVPWLVMYIAKDFPASDTPGLNNEGNLPIEGKMTLDTSSVLDYTDLPWSNIEDGSNLSNGRIRRIKGAGQICISPIIAGVAYGYWGDTYRTNLTYNYGNDWFFNTTTSNVQEIGIEKSIPIASDIDKHKQRTLTRGDIDVTPASTILKWTSGVGTRVPAYESHYATAMGNVGGDYVIFTACKQLANKLLQTASLNPDYNSAENINAIKNYLNNKKSTYESYTGHSPVPGTSNMDAWVGGAQLFNPARTILSYNGKLLKKGSDYYKIVVKQKHLAAKTKMSYYYLNNNNPVENTSNTLRDILIRSEDFPEVSWPPYSGTANSLANPENTMVETWINAYWFDVTYEKVTSDILRFTLPKPAARVQLNDAAYDMICFPFGAIDFVIPNDGNTEDLTFTSSKEASLGMARSIAAQIGSAMYDLQLLPYCPYRQVAEQYGEDGYINLGLTSQFPYACWSGVYKIVLPNDEPSRANARSFGLWCHSSSGTIDINHIIETPALGDSIEYKTFSACKKFRLVAPNYTSVFEFNPLKNNGVVLFNVDYNYRPYNPYIHIAPYFNSEGLYGVDTNDNRGLILQGDFSVGYYSDAWAQYQINNANYANIFNRQLQNIDFNQKQEREKWDVNRITGWVTEGLGLGGGMQGAKAFSGLGPWGMLGGGIGGTVGGLIGQGVGVEYYDRKWMNEAMAEERSYAIDNYNMALGNVKALPYGLAKSDALNENFKYFPFIEEYDCTNIEKTYFRNKLYYDGMTVGAIDVIENYIPTADDFWVKICGRMIRLESLADDFQIANAIYTEVEKGFYYQSSYVNEGD